MKQIDFDQLGLILGLISMSQQGVAPSLEALDPDTQPAPNIEGIDIASL